MEDVSPTHIEQRLASDGLSRLTRLLQTYKQKVVIAGSYTFAIHPEEQTKPEMRPGDLDLWIPWLPNNESSKVLGAVLACLVDSGYSEVSSRHQNPDARLSGTRNDSYKRMDDMIDTIYTVREPPLDFQDRRKVQILLLQKAGGRDAEQVIRHFDLNLSRQYYDGFRVWRPRPVGDDVRAHRITLNTTSAVIRDQSFGEWVRTLRRIHKYSIHKGLTMSPSVVSTLHELVPAALSRCKWRECKRVRQSIISYRLSIMGYIQEWNRLATMHPHLPIIAFTVVPPGRYVSDVRLVLCRDPLLPNYPEQGYEQEEHMTKHYNRLLESELKTVTKPAGDTGRAQSICLALQSVDREPPRVHVSSLVAYPAVAEEWEQDREQNCEECVPLLPRTCLEPYLRTQVDVPEYIRHGTSTPGRQDTFVFYFQGQAYGVHRQAIDTAPTFVPCEEVVRSRAWSEMASVATLEVAPGLSFNIPTRQLKTLLNLDEDTRHLYRIVTTEYSWDRSQRLEVSWDGTQRTVGDCLETPRTISLLEHILCCQEDWFTAVPVGENT